MTTNMITKDYRIAVPGLQKTQRILHFSDVHFSGMTTEERNRSVSAQLLRKAALLRPDFIAVTGDMVSRNPGRSGIPDAVVCLAKLRKIAPVYFVPGNHEMDLPPVKRKKLLQSLQAQGVEVLCNRTVQHDDLSISGVVLPKGMYKNEKGGYSGLLTCTEEMLRKRLGTCRSHPNLLLAHSPMGLRAYALWGADIVLSGHVHGGIIRLPVIGGVLSPERKFFPEFTKGVYSQGDTTMVVTAGIGKLRIGNPPETLCIDLLPERMDYGIK